MTADIYGLVYFSRSPSIPRLTLMYASSIKVITMSVKPGHVLKMMTGSSIFDFLAYYDFLLLPRPNKYLFCILVKSLIKDNINAMQEMNTIIFKRASFALTFMIVLGVNFF